ncbi:hypothetical protein [Streptomyces poonensis]|uniref:Uncharacterized protein n=1 Tax=Streptomyces poonensis TaxID=68255 RepID=A0A918PCC1_9ACTN|nr:hypothetical protein [Streptomyces poonensis]GGY99766.1 hypothetical protein GCM10010365_18120 [Streptomyces poonensis]GLJ92199.1 hypothetical protein GCM10017589_48080 [Streptomyces poonensis]
MKQSGTTTLLQGAVQDLASGVVSALRGGDHTRESGTWFSVSANDGTGDLALAAVRVLGADAVLPHVLLRMPPGADQLALFSKAMAAYPPATGAAPTLLWSHWGMTRALRALRRLDAPPADRPTGAEDHEHHEHHERDERHEREHPESEPDAGWLEDVSWQVLTHQLAVLAPLAVPGEDSAVARAARRRPVDVARGFVRAVRRRDWLQAAGAGRWLTLLEGVPDTLGLESGLDFVALMGGDDPRVALQVRAAQLMRTGEPV